MEWGQGTGVQIILNRAGLVNIGEDMDHCGPALEGTQRGHDMRGEWLLHPGSHRQAREFDRRTSRVGPHVWWAMVVECTWRFQRKDVIWLVPLKRQPWRNWTSHTIEKSGHDSPRGAEAWHGLAAAGQV